MSEIKINEHLAARRSRRAFDENKPVSEEDIHALLEAARWAPSGGNGQPWRFVVGVRGDKTFEQLAQLLMEGNRTWAKHAGLLVLSVAQVVRTGADGKPQSNRTALHDLGMANMSMAVEATHRGMNVRMMGGYNYPAAKALLQADANGWDLGPVLAIGWPNDGAHLSAELQQRDTEPRSRKPISEIRMSL